MQAPVLPPFRLRIASNNLAVRQALIEISHALRPLHLDADEYGTVELVLAEVLNNIVEHAHEYRATQDQVIDIHCAVSTDGLHLKITDDGSGMPGGKAPGGCIQVPDAEDLPEGGFGWYLINRLAKDVRYSRRNGKNCLDFWLAVGVAS